MISFLISASSTLPAVNTVVSTVADRDVHRYTEIEVSVQTFSCLFILVILPYGHTTVSLKELS